MSLLSELQTTLSKNVVPKLLSASDLECFESKEMFFKSSNVILFDKNLSVDNDLNYYFYLQKDPTYFTGLYGLDNIVFNNIIFAATSFNSKDLEVKSSDVFGFQPLFINKLDKEYHKKLKKDLFESINSYVDITEHSVNELFDCLYLKDSSSIMDTLFFYHDRDECTVMCVENPKPDESTSMKEFEGKKVLPVSVEGTCELIGKWCDIIKTDHGVKEKIFSSVKHLIEKLDCYVKIELSLTHKDSVRLVVFPGGYRPPITNLVDFFVEKGYIKSLDVSNQLKLWCADNELEHDNFEYGFNHFTLIYDKHGHHTTRVVYGVCDLNDGSRPYSTVKEKHNQPEHKEPIVNL